MEHLLTTRDAASFFQVSSRTIQRWVEQGMLPCIRFGRGSRTVRFRAEDVQWLVSQLSNGPRHPTSRGSGEKR